MTECKGRTTKWQECITERKERITQWQERITEWKERVTEGKERITEWQERITEWKERITEWKECVSTWKELIKTIMDQIWFALKAVSTFRKCQMNTLKVTEGLIKQCTVKELSKYLSRQPWVVFWIFHGIRTRYTIKVQTHSSLKPPLEYNQQTPMTNQGLLWPI